MLRIITDTGGDVTYLGAPEIGMEAVELAVQFEEFPYDYRNDTDFTVFYETLEKSKKLPTTSQPTPAQYLDIFEDAKEKGDEVLVLTISAGISGTYQSAMIAQEMSDYDRISVVDSRHATVSQRMLADHAVTLRDAGKSRAEIVAELEELREQVVLLVLLPTLKFLQKGGRVPMATAVLGEMLNMKPFVTMQDGKVTPIGKARGLDAGKRALCDQFAADGHDPAYPVYFGYTYNRETGETFRQETCAKYGLAADSPLCSVGGVIGTYGGPNCIAIAYKKK